MALFAQDLFATDLFATDLFVGIGEEVGGFEGASLTTEGGLSKTRPPVYVVNINGVDYLVDSLEAANELVAANTPTVEPLPPEEPLPRFEVTIPEPRPEPVALPRAQTGIRKLV